MPQGCKRVAAIHDMSGFGRCSLSVILPVMSCLGVQCCPVPTAVLSTHTGGFSQVAMEDLSPFLSACLSHWQREEVRMDCVYSGFLASHGQVRLVEDFFAAYPAALRVVDPVMGDGGKPYSTCDEAYVESMRGLAAKAHVITPNPTEAALLLGRPFCETPDLSQAIEQLLALSRLGPEMVIVTGLSFQPGTLTNLAYVREKKQILKCDSRKLATVCHGTGDIFASIVTGELCKGRDLTAAMEKAAWFVAACMEETGQAATPRREGLCFEPVLPRLTSYQQSRKEDYHVSTEIITDF